MLSAYFSLFKKYFWFCFLSLVLLLPPPALADQFSRLKDRRYDVVRGELIDESWRPASPRCDRFNARECEVYPELEACAGTGSASCLFWWKNEARGLLLKIVTVGEFQRTISRVQITKK
jgi:hypothetical protein